MSHELRIVADLMCISARTAPKSAGQDYVVTKVLEGDECRILGEAMMAHGVGTPRQKGFERDGQNVKDSPVIVLIGIKDAKPMGLNCGACGHEECIQINTFHGHFDGPQCALRHLDLGIALGSAVKTASILNVDNRIMYRVGLVAKKIGQIEADFVMGIPLSVTGKSPYFDRKTY
jgi:uncharacterized ferredoxin-like protein